MQPITALNGIIGALFQSSFRPEGRMQHRNGVLLEVGHRVSILIRPEGRMQLDAIAEAMDMGMKFQSSSGQKAGMQLGWH